MKVPYPEEEIITKDVKNLWWLEKLKKKISDTTSKDIKTPFGLKKGN